MASKTIVCYGCGKDISDESQSSNRFSLFNPSHSKTFAIWKDLVRQQLIVLESDIDVEEISQDTKDGTACRVCRSCSSAMVRLNQLDSRVRLNINNAITAICNVRGMPVSEAEPDQQGPSRAEPDQERPSRKRSHSESLNETTRTRNSHSPDVSVSHI